MAFYEENSEIKIATSRKLLVLTLDMKNIEFFINQGRDFNKDSLNWTVSRNLKDDYKKSMEFCIYL